MPEWDATCRRMYAWMCMHLHAHIHVSEITPSDRAMLIFIASTPTSLSPALHHACAHTIHIDIPSHAETIAYVTTYDTRTWHVSCDAI